MYEPHEEPIEVIEKPSKTQLKKIATAATKFVDQLTKLSAIQLSKLDLPEEVLRIILQAKKTKVSGGRNRLLKGASSLLRNDEIWGTEAAAKQFDRIATGNHTLKIETKKD